MQSTLKYSEAGYLFLELMASLLLITTVISIYVTQNLKQQHQLSKAHALKQKNDAQENWRATTKCIRNIDNFEVSRITCKNGDSRTTFIEEML